MSVPTKAKWDSHYLANLGATPEPSLVLAEHAHLLPSSGVALDLACGLGGNALFLARRGLTVTAWDISPVAIEKLEARAQGEGLRITTEVVDVETVPLKSNTYDIVTVSRFLNRSLSHSIVSSLRAGGLLFYQTFTANKMTPSGPSNSAYLLAENELLQLFASLHVRFFREDAHCGDLSIGRRDEAYFIGQRSWSD